MVTALSLTLSSRDAEALQDHGLLLTGIFTALRGCCASETQPDWGALERLCKHGEGLASALMDQHGRPEHDDEGGEP